MNKIFCVSCGAKNVYEATKPKFCASCGCAVAGVSVASSDVSEVEETELANIDLNKLKRSVGVDYVNSYTKIEDVLGKGGDTSPMQRRASSLPDGQQIIKQNMLDCAKASRSNDIDE